MQGNTKGAGPVRACPFADVEETTSPEDTMTLAEQYETSQLEQWPRLNELLLEVEPPHEPEAHVSTGTVIVKVRADGSTGEAASC